MIPTAFDYHRAGSLDEALGLVGDAGDEGHRRRAEPPAADEAAPREPRAAGRHRPARRAARASASCPTAGVAIGALTTYAELLDVTGPARTADPARRAAGHRRRPGPQPRHGRRRDRPRRSGLGPAGGPARPRRPRSSPGRERGERVVPPTGSSPAPFTTGPRRRRARHGDPPPGPRDDAGSAYRSLAQRASGYSIVGVAAVVDQGGRQRDHAGRDRPHRGRRARRTGRRPSRPRSSATRARPTAIAAAAAHATDGVTVNSDIHADASTGRRWRSSTRERAIERGPRPG